MAGSPEASEALSSAETGPGAEARTLAGEEPGGQPGSPEPRSPPKVNSAAASAPRVQGTGPRLGRKGTARRGAGAQVAALGRAHQGHRSGGCPDRCQPGGIRARPRPPPLQPHPYPQPPVQPAASGSPALPGRSTAGPGPRPPGPLQGGGRSPRAGRLPSRCPTWAAGARRGEEPRAQGSGPAPPLRSALPAAHRPAAT